MLNTLVLFPGSLTPEEIGLLRFFPDTAALLAPIAHLGITGIILRFFPRWKDEREQRNAFLGVVLGVMAVGLILVCGGLLLLKPLVLELFSNEAETLGRYYHLLIAIVMLTVVQGVVHTYSRAQLNTVLPAFMRDVFMRAATSTIVLIYSVYQLQQGRLLEMYMGVLLVAVATILVALWRMDMLGFGRRFTALGTGWQREMATYGGFVILNAGSTTLVVKLDTLMLTGLDSLGTTGIYSISFFLATVVEMPRRALLRIGQPIIARSMEANDMATVSRIYNQTALNLLIVGLFMFVGIYASVDHIFDVMPKGETYRQGTLVVLFIGLARLVDMMTGTNNEIIVYSKHYRFNLVLMISLIGLGFLFNLWLIPLYGLTGAAMATALSFAVFNLAKTIFVAVKFKMQPFGWRNLAVVVLGVATYFIAIQVPDLGNPWLMMLVKSTIVTVLFGSVVFGLNLSPALKNLALDALSRVGLVQKKKKK